MIAAVKNAIENYDSEADGYENGAKPTGDGSLLSEEAAAYRRSADILRAVLKRLQGLAAPGEASSAMVQRDICEALMESQYLAGLRKGWNLGVADDQAGYAAVVKSREGYLAALSKPPVTL